MTPIQKHGQGCIRRADHVTGSGDFNLRFDSYERTTVYWSLVYNFTCYVPVLVTSVGVSDTAAGDQPGLVVRKLQQCCVVFNFDDPLADVKSKEVKRACLNELIAALNDTRGLLTEAVCMEVVHMVSVAICMLCC